MPSERALTISGLQRAGGNDITLTRYGGMGIINFFPPFCTDIILCILNLNTMSNVRMSDGSSNVI